MAKKITWKIWLLLISIFFSLVAIFGVPPISLEKGVVISSIDQDSDAFNQGLRSGQVISAIDGKQILLISDYSNLISGKNYGGNESIKTEFKLKNSEIILFTNESLSITVSDIPNTYIQTGLDIAGGSRALIKAKDNELGSKEINDLVDITRNRLNAFGISDIKVLPVSDLGGNYFMLVELAGATPKALKEILSKQGKFEAKIGNESVFIGGEKDISSVSRDAQNSFVETCQQVSSGGWACKFIFSIVLAEEAANRHADITGRLDVNSSNPQYLSESLNLYLDDKLVESLFIGKDLKGRATTQIAISGSGSGATKEEAYDSAVSEMKRLQTILITGSLPYQLEIVKLDTISPALGKEFVKSILLAGFLSLLVVSIIILARYRKFKLSLALLVTSISEIIIILGFASLIKWNLDLPSIAGILVTIGTGVDQQIIILDESRQKEGNFGIGQKLRIAFAIILGAYFTGLVSLLPLIWAGAGLLKGFAITTILGITIGVLITRPAFTDIIKIMEDE